MAGGRPQKKLNANMAQLSSDLDSPHMPDEWHDLFDLYNVLEEYPKLTAIIQRQIETVFQRHLKSKKSAKLELKRPFEEIEAKKVAAKFQADTWAEFDPVFANWISSKKIATTKTKHSEVLVIKTEAHFLLKVASNMAHKVVSMNKFRKHLDHNFDVKTIAAEAISKLLVSGTYNITADIGQKLTYLKTAVSSAASERLRDKLRNGSNESDQDLIDSPKYTARKRTK